MKQENVTPPVMRISDAAEYLAVSKTTLYQEMDSGRLPYVRVRTVRRLRRVDLDAWIGRNLVRRDKNGGER